MPIQTGGSSSPDINSSIVVAKGDLIAGTAATAVDNLPVGANGQVLTADSSQAMGVKWSAIAGGILDWAATTVYAIGDYVNESNKIYKCIVAHTAGTFAADLLSANWVEVSTAPMASTVETEAGALTTKAVTPAAGDAVYVKKSAFNAKGDLISASADNTPAILSTGSNGQLLAVNTAQPSGLEWVDPAEAATELVVGIVELADATETEAGTDDTRAVHPAGAAATFIKKSAFNAKGDILAATADDTPSVVSVGLNGEVLTADSAEAAGVKWVHPNAPITQTAHGFAVGDWIAVNGSGYVKGQANAVGTADVVGRVREVIDANTFRLSGEGDYLTGLAGLTPGVYYLDAATAGAIAATAPIAAGHVNKPVFLATSATTGHVQILRGAVVGDADTADGVVVVDGSAEFPVSEPVAPATGDRYIAISNGTGSISTGTTFTENNLYTWNGTAWVEDVVTEGRVIYDKSTDSIYRYNGTQWTTDGSWILQGIVITLAANSSYVLLAAGTFPLPAGAASGDIVTVVPAMPGCLVSTSGVFYGSPGQLTTAGGSMPLPSHTIITLLHVGGGNWSYVAPQSSRKEFADIAASGTLGTLADMMTRMWVLDQTTASIAVTLPAAVDPANTTILTIYNRGSAAISIEGESVLAGTIRRFIFDGTSWVPEVGASGNLYSTDGTLSANRTVDLDGNDLVFAESAQSKATINADGVAGTRMDYIASPHTFATGVALAPTDAFQFYYPIANATSTGNCVIDSFSGGSVNSVVMFALQNADAVSRDFVFNTAYKGFDAATDLGTVTLAAGARRFVRFRMTQSGTTWTLVEDSAGAAASAGINLWATATTYTAGQYIEEDFKLYRCLTGHTSGTFATDLAAANWVEVSRAFDDWEFAANSATALVLHSYILTPGNTINMPAAPANGDAVRFATLSEWSAANITFTAPGATTVADGQTGVLAGYDVVEFVYDSVADNWVALLGGAAAPDIAIPIDASGSAQTITLPAATGAGTIKRYVIKDKTNTITFAVQVGEYLNEVLDDTYLGSNHAVGTYFEIVDYATGKWSLQVVGAATTPSLARYSVRGVAATVTTANGPNILPIGSLVDSDLVSSGMLLASEYDPLGWRTANQITVSKTGRYRVDVNVVHTSANLSGTDTQTDAGSSRAGIRINGTSIEWVGIDDSAGLADQMSGFIVRQFTAGDEIDVVVNATSVETGEDYYVSFAMEELPTTETILAGHVVPTPLEYWQAWQVSASSVSANITGFTYPLTTSNFGTVGNVNSFAASTKTNSNAAVFDDTSNTSVEVQVAGRYRITSSISMDTTANIQFYSQILRNGAIIAENAAGIDTINLGAAVTTHCMADLSVGDVISFAVIGQTTSLQMSSYNYLIEQVPTSTVVNPDTVPVTALANSVRVVPTSTMASTPSFTTLTGCTYTVPANMAGRVRIDMHAGFANGSDDDRYAVAAIHKNGVVVSESLGNGWAKQSLNYIESIETNCEITVSTGDVLDLRVRNAGGAGSASFAGAPQDGSTVNKFSYFTVTPVPQYSVIQPEDTIVNDQAASGYMDIGTMRMQWIKGSYGNGTNVVLPASFANTNYVVTSMAGQQNVMAHASVKTTTGFTVVSNIVHDGSVGGPYLFEFIAIGLKP